MLRAGDIPLEQKAWIAVRKGIPAQAVVLDEHASMPSEMKGDDVLVKVQAAALNPVYDHHALNRDINFSNVLIWASGHKLLGLLPNFIAGRPHVVEYDFVGTIVSSRDPNVQIGQDVIGFIPVRRC